MRDFKLSSSEVKTLLYCLLIGNYIDKLHHPDDENWGNLIDKFQGIYNEMIICDTVTVTLDD